MIDMNRLATRSPLLVLAAALAACGGGDDPGGTDGGVIVVDGGRTDGAGADGAGTDGNVIRPDGATDWCEGYTPRPGATLCTSADVCGGASVGDVCYPVGASCCPVKMIAPRDCESDGACAKGEVCQEYLADTACTSGVGTRCVPPCSASAPCVDGTCDATGHCIPLQCPSAWTCPENYECDPGRAGADAHGCAPTTCTTAADCDCGECVNGACASGPGYCGFSCECAAPDTAIATPEGERAISELRAGDMVFTVDDGAIVVAPLALVGRRPAAPGHEVVRVTLASGRSFRMSRGHPTADGRALGDVHGGDLLGSAEIIDVAVEPYDASHTYDILPASSTGAYFAAGALVGSTLR